MIENKKYFEKHKYRAPTDPVVKAFVLPKLKFIEACGCFEKKDMKVLDVGSGNGTFGHYLSEFANNIFCLDYSLQLINTNPCALKVRGDVYELPFPDKIFDVVFEANVLHHLDSPMDAVAEMARCSRKYIVIIEPNRYNPLMFLFSLLVPSERGGCGSFKKRWADALRDAGFKLTGCTVTGMISQQNTPKVLIPLLRLFDFDFWLGEYIVLVGEKNK